MRRKIYDRLLEWKNKDGRKPLILQGARQVGKTYIVNLFGVNEYSDFVYCNFEKDSNLAEFFCVLDPKIIVSKLELYKRKKIIPKETLIIFDEIQACPSAITSLKYFNEEANEYHVIALGSLLGVSTHRNNYSFPVGKVEFMNMYPMDFEEYLLAKNEENLVNMIKECYNNDSYLENAFHERALNYYKEYLLIGGLPEVVEEYIKNKNYELARIKQLDILDSYFDDMGKYNKESEIPKTKIVYKSISSQLAKENKKFQYRMIKKGGRASEFENSIEWISLAGIANQLYRVEQILLPLNAYKSLTDFKFFMNDVGLCCASMDVRYEDIYYGNTLLNNFKGGLTENYVNNQLIVNGVNSFYWTSGNEAEIDFVVRLKDDILPIEVKSSDNNKSKSLLVYSLKYNPKYSIRISSKNFGFENNIKSVPLYAVFCILK